jgi:hypothetical protein
MTEAERGSDQFIRREILRRLYESWSREPRAENRYNLLFEGIDPEWEDLWRNWEYLQDVERAVKIIGSGGPQSGGPLVALAIPGALKAEREKWAPPELVLANERIRRQLLERIEQNHQRDSFPYFNPLRNELGLTDGQYEANIGVLEYLGLVEQPFGHPMLTARGREEARRRANLEREFDQQREMLVRALDEFERKYPELEHPSLYVEISDQLQRDWSTVEAIKRRVVSLGERLLRLDPEGVAGQLTGDVEERIRRIESGIDMLLALDAARRERMSAPAEIAESLAKFRRDHPDPSKVAFVMMRFGNTPAHREITETIRQTLQEVGIKGLRADDKDYNDNLFLNIQTYMHGCDIGVAVFERIEQEDFNPNVSLEVGYMIGLGKPVCLLKDRTLRALQTDLVGRLYRAFDPQRAGTTIGPELKKWLEDRGLSSAASSPH